jgi:hypothetical protein
MSATASRLVSNDQAVRLGRRHRREAAQQRAQARVLQLAELAVGAVLQRLDAVEHEQSAPPHHRLGDRFALRGGAVGRGSDAELVHCPVQERVGRGRTLLRALAVERPSQHRRRAAIIVGLHPLHRRLQEALHIGQPLETGLGPLRLVLMGVADEDDRLRHDNRGSKFAIRTCARR